MKPYKKRAKAGWNTDKEQSNKDERAFAKREINELLNEEENPTELAKAPTKAKKKPLKAKDVRNKIKYTEDRIKFFSSDRYKSNWIKGVIARYEKKLKELNELLSELEKK